jgi:release factor glutamine methyltransferase
MYIRDARRDPALPTAENEILLAAILKKDRSWVLAHEEESLSEEQLKQWSEWKNRRLTGEPIAYITGKKEFYGRSFLVTPAVLIPRPATEGLIDAVSNFLKTRQPSITEIDTDIVAWCQPLGQIQPDEPLTIVDIGTGSGCIAVTLALQYPDLRVIATDISADALEVAQKNAIVHRAEVEFLQGDTLDPILTLEEPFIIVSNPPYIEEGKSLMKDVQEFEPHMALFAGEKGMDVIEKILNQAKKQQFCRGVCLECGKNQVL